MAPSQQAKSSKSARSLLTGLAIGACLLTGLPDAEAQAPAKRPPAAPQATPQVAPQAAPQAVPGFWDPRRRPERPDLSRLTVIRFLTETDYPPFNFTGADGNPAGFNVDLARSLCEEIKVTCTVQMRRFETLVDALTSNRGDAIIASMAVSPQLRARVDFTDPYYRVPARFVSRKDAVMPEIRPEYLEGKKVGVIAGSAHEAYLKAMFTDAELHAYPSDDAMRAALRRGEVDFTKPYYANFLAYIAKKNSGLATDMASLKGKVIGAQRATVSAQFLEDELSDNVKIKLYDTQTAAYSDLKTGRLDAMLSDIYPALQWINDPANSGYELTGDRIDIDDQIGIAVRKGNDVLRQALNWALFRVWEKGRYTDLWLRYFSVSPF